MTCTHSNYHTILFSGHDFRFLMPFLDHCRRSPRYRVLVDQHVGHDISNPDRCRHLLRQADIIFCEWCLGNAVWYSRYKTANQRLLVRLHLQEMCLSYLDQVHWDNVDALILICPHNNILIRQRYPNLKGKTHLIYNPIDCAALAQPKLPGAEFNLGLLGMCPRRKQPHLALEILEHLKQFDSRYTLFVKGKHPHDYDWLWRRPDERSYYERVFKDIEMSPYANAVVFEQYGEDVSLWFSKIGFILSTSEFEGSHQAVAEGMASGSVPVIRKWAGADLLYPGQFIFSTGDEAVESIRRTAYPNQYLRAGRTAKAFATARFSCDSIIASLERLLTFSDVGSEHTAGWDR